MVMLTELDIDLIHGWRDELISNREFPIKIVYLEKQYDPINGMPIGEKEVEREINAVITELSSAIPERTVEGGFKHIEGDIKFDVSIDLISDIVGKIERIKYDGENYEIAAIDKKGIGRRNRYEIIGRLIA